MRNRSNLCKKMDFEKFDDRTLLNQGRAISTILKAMALKQNASSRSENLHVSCRKRG